MKFKIFCISIGFSAMMLLNSSCKKEYLETSPTTAVSESAVFTSIANSTAALNGIHRYMYQRWNDQGTFGYGTIMLYNDCMGEDLVFTAQSNGWFVGSYRWIDHRNANGNAYFPYQFFFRLISNANAIIEGINNVPGSDAARNAIKGQALAYRAFSYFNLVQLYGKRFEKGTPNDNPGVPLILTVTLEPTARSTVAEVYAQVNKDLSEAESLLTSSRADKSNFNVNVVRGLQARVALTQQDWALAASKAAQARAGFTLMSGTQQVEGFANYDNPEWMWGSRQIDDQTEFFTAFLAYISYNFNSTNIRGNPKLINSTLYNSMAANDVRRALWRPLAETSTVPAVLTPPGGVKKNFMTQKFKAKDGSNSQGDIPYMRAAEMYLIEAEALARDGKDDQAATIFTTFQVTRVPGFTKPTQTGQALINLIMNSRRVELWGEGFRFLDLKRLNLPLDRLGANHSQTLAVIVSMPAGANDWQYVIPQAELNANPLAKQNP